jgi:hypothetical protein
MKKSLDTGGLNDFQGLVALVVMIWIALVAGALTHVFTASDKLAATVGIIIWFAYGCLGALGVEWVDDGTNKMVPKFPGTLPFIICCFLGAFTMIRAIDELALQKSNCSRRKK